MPSFKAIRVRGLGSMVMVAGWCLLTGCTSFNQEWKKAAGAPVPGEPLAGPWQGVWVSDVTGHTDVLRCLVTPRADGSYSARFHAKYRKIFTFGYTVPLKAECNDGVARFEGDADLGWFAGGVYHYAGHAETTNFFSTYASKYDAGTFRLKRPN
jgi:hypothetical protein